MDTTLFGISFNTACHTVPWHCVTLVKVSFHNYIRKRRDGMLETWHKFVVVLRGVYAVLLSE